MAIFTWGTLDGRWPKPATERPRRSDWYTDRQRAMRKLSGELDRLRVGTAQILADVAPADIKIDKSGLYANTRFRTERVMIRFRIPEVGEVEYACDTYSSLVENLHAVAMTLERLRLVDQYGATIGGQHQQYRGFKRLGAGGIEMPAQAEAPMEPMDAAANLVRLAMPDVTDQKALDLYTNDVFRDAETFRFLARKAARNAHPDTGGSADRFHLYQRAHAVLLTKHGSGEPS